MNPWLRIVLVPLIILFAAGGAPSVAWAQGALKAPLGSEPVIDGAILPEPLVRTGPTGIEDDAALIQTLAEHQRQRQAAPGDLSALRRFAAEHPNSGWTPAVETNLGLLYLHEGYFQEAIDAFRAAWALGKSAQDPQAKALIDRAVGQLAALYSSFGQFDQLSALFDEIGHRPISGSATELIQNARDNLALVNKDPRHLFNCGPVALKYLILAVEPQTRRAEFLQWYRASSKGTSLAELGRLASQAGFPYRLVVRKPGQSIPTLAVASWKVGHFSAIVGYANGRYHVKDPMFPAQDLWMTRDALESESTGYFLIPASEEMVPGWRQASAGEASNVWGKGPTNGTPPGNAGGQPGGPPNPGDPDPPNPCMCGYGISESVVGLVLSDTPVGYAPPIGPAPKITITYNQREDSQPANFSFFNVSQKWTLNWLSYITDDPANPGANVSRYIPGGGAYYYTGYTPNSGQFAAETDDRSILVLASQSAGTYRRQLIDGTVQVFAKSNGATSYPRNVFLSQVIDSHGNSITLNYDSQMRLMSLTDSAGRQTTFTYNLVTEPLLVTQVRDPFGRAATFAYDAQGRLSSITDTIGITSSFAYDANSLIDQMTTPYGTTTFAYTAPGTSGAPRFLQINDPMGYHEREEWLEPAPISDSDPAATVPQGMPLAPTNEYLTYRDSFYWDRNAYVAAGCTPAGGCDYTKARDTHFLHVANTSLKSTAVESIKYPLENRIWYQYPGQVSSIYTGTSMKPIAIARVLDDGTTQISRSSYDTAGQFELTQKVDPLGRTTNYNYANQIDLSAISQTTAYGFQTTIAQFIYNAQHRPIFATDAAGQTTGFTYNSAGQLATATNPLGHTTTYHYDGSANLSSVTNANNATAVSYTYDAFDRIATSTDSEGWTVHYSYDAADRITAITYPDGTSKTFTYNKLDLASVTDRLGRVWTYAHDADRRLTSMTDPQGAQTLFAYNPSGELTGRTDPKGNLTQWAYDIEGRTTTKTYVDSSTLTYAYEPTTSRLLSTTDARSQTKTFAYAQDDRPLSITYTGAVNPTPNVNFTYDPYFPRLTSMTDGTGTTTYAYEPVGSLGALQLAQETPPLTGVAINYAYDPLGRLSSRTVAGSGAETFGYDAIGRLTSHGSDLGAFTLAYLGQTSQIVSRALAGSALATTWTYLPNPGDRRLSGVSTTGLTAGQSTGFTFTTDDESQITGGTQTSDATISYPPSSFSQSAVYNTLNQLTTLSAQTLTYDADGNLTSDGTLTYAWDAENRLVGISYPSQPGKATAFAYDGLGRRIQISSTPAGGGSAVVTSYVWCGSSLCQARNSSAGVSKGYYVEGEFAPSGGVYYAPDQVGTVRRAFAAVSGPAYDNDPYGVPLQTTAPATDFTYAGLLNNPDSGLLLGVNRVYNSNIGRWVTRDPMGESGDPFGNLYAYGAGDPIDESDPFGLTVSLQFNATFIINPFGPRNGVTVSGGVFFNPNGPNGIPQAGTYVTTGNGNGIDISGQIQGTYTPGDASNMSGPSTSDNGSVGPTGGSYSPTNGSVSVAVGGGPLDAGADITYTCTTLWDAFDWIAQGLDNLQHPVINIPLHP